MKLALSTVAVLLLTFSAAGCVEDEVFMSCPFDQTITQNCARSGDSTADFTCVVEDHPQCPQGVCLSWKNSDPFCTLPCTVGGLECPNGSKCAQYAGEKWFCVQDEILVPPKP